MKRNRNDAPLVSVVMPAYNAEKFLLQAVCSVMAQTVTDWELLILDDGSTDATAALAAQLAAQDSRVRLLKNDTNMGVAKTRNRALKLCCGHFIAFLDSDDVWQPEKLERQLRLLAQTGADLAYTAYAIIDEQGRRIRNDYLVPPQTDFEKMLRENVMGCSTVMLRAASLGQRRFAEDCYHEDYALWLQLLRSGHRAVGCPEVLVSWRRQANSRSFDKRKAAAQRWQVYRKQRKLPLWKSIWVFACYALAGWHKYGAGGKI